MVRKKVTSFWVLALFLILSGCTKKTTVILLPDPDGKVGHITVSSKLGAVDLTRGGEATVISGKESVPSRPNKLSDDKIKAEFSHVLSILPDQPIHFVLYFQSESTKLTSASEKILPKILEAIEDKNSRYISVIGHSDTAGDPQYNLQLSQNRAKAISHLLVENGIDSALINSESHGENNPLIQTADNVHERKNRRVEVVVR